MVIVGGGCPGTKKRLAWRGRRENEKCKVQSSAAIFLQMIPGSPTFSVLKKKITIKTSSCMLSASMMLTAAGQLSTDEEYM